MRYALTRLKLPKTNITLSKQYPYANKPLPSNHEFEGASFPIRKHRLQCDVPRPGFTDRELLYVSRLQKASSPLLTLATLFTGRGVLDPQTGLSGLSILAAGAGRLPDRLLASVECSQLQGT